MTAALVFKPCATVSTYNLFAISVPAVGVVATVPAVKYSVLDVSNTSFPVPLAPVDVTPSKVTCPVALTVVNAAVLGVAAPIAPGTGNDATLAVPSKLVPPIVLAVANAVAVDALPTTAPVKVVALTVVNAPVLGVAAPIAPGRNRQRLQRG